MTQLSDEEIINRYKAFRIVRHLREQLKKGSQGYKYLRRVMKRLKEKNERTN